MRLNLAKELAALQKMGTNDLRARYAEVFAEPTRSGNRPWLIKRIAWRLQAAAEGGLSDRALQRAEELARDADPRLRPPPEVRKAMPTGAPPATSTIPFKTDQRLPTVGTVLVGRYKGEDVQVRVLVDGFEHDGEVYSSLSAVARAITGSHCNGYHFFRDALNGQEGGK
jgi:Protein of unknown function (DUF2924)